MTVPLSSPYWLQAKGWDRFPDLVHGFSSRLPTRDALAGFACEGLTLRTVTQVHSNEIVVIDQHSTSEARPQADGMITAEMGILLGIVTADCVPVLMVEPDRGIVVALHAGWRGTLQGISVRVIEMLQMHWEIHPRRLWVALGPAIGGCCYEVGRDVGEALCQRWGGCTPAAWQPRGEKGFLDLRALNSVQCQRAGVLPAQIQSIALCTFCDPVRFTSYRREGPRAGRQLSVIGRQLNRNT